MIEKRIISEENEQMFKQLINEKINKLDDEDKKKEITNKLNELLKLLDE